MKCGRIINTARFFLLSVSLLGGIHLLFVPVTIVSVTESDRKSKNFQMFAIVQVCHCHAFYL